MRWAVHVIHSKTLSPTPALHHSKTLSPTPALHHSLREAAKAGASWLARYRSLVANTDKAALIEQGQLEALCKEAASLAVDMPEVGRQGGGSGIPWAAWAAWAA